MLNVALAREIYGGGVLAIDQRSFSSMLNLLSDFRSGAMIESSDKERLNSVGFMSVQAGTRVVSYTGSIDANSGDQYISLTRLNGPIVKNSGMSTTGTKEMSDTLLAFDANPKVIGHIILADSGGGSAAGMEVINHAMDALTKPKAAVVERGGIACSAAYGIIAHADRIFAESAKSEVGSIGSMISFKAQPNKSVNVHGEKQVTIYATPSTKKNLWFEEALNNDNYDLALSELLDPHVEDFRGDMRSQRPGIKETQLDGSVYNAGDVLGSLVDEIGGMNEAISFIQAEHAKKNVSNNNKVNNKTAMTAQELLAQHPAVYAEIFGAGKTAGITAEADRVAAWMAHNGTDQEAVKAGVLSGKEITAAAREEFFVKANAKANLEAVKNDSAPPATPPEADSKEVKPTETQAFYADVLKGLKGGK